MHCIYIRTTSDCNSSVLQCSPGQNAIVNGVCHQSINNGVCAIAERSHLMMGKQKVSPPFHPGATFV